MTEGKGNPMSERIRKLAELLPDGAAVTLSKHDLLALAAEQEMPQPAQAPAEMTVETIAAEMNRAPSTVRGWLERGEIEGAYRFRGREWRVPRAAFEAFKVRGGAPAPTVDAKPETRADLSSWRKAG